MNLLLLPLRYNVVFPGETVPVTISRENTLAVVSAARDEIVVTRQVNERADTPSLEDVSRVAVRCALRRSVETEDGQGVTLEGLERVRIEAYDAPMVAVEPYPFAEGETVDALRRAVVAQAEALLTPDFRTPLPFDDFIPRDPLGAAVTLARMLHFTAAEEQRLLEQATLEDALRLLARRLKEEEARRRATAQARDDRSMQSVKRRAYYLQSLSEATGRLGHRGNLQGEALKKHVEDAGLPESVMLRLLEEVAMIHSGHHVRDPLSTWVRFVADLPFARRASASLDLDAARAVLDADQVGLDDVKTRVLEHARVLQMNAHARGPVLCLVGPPGVGKTCLARSLARALARPFEHIALGGAVRSDLFGTTRRGPGSPAPGMVAQALRRARCANPVILLDEVDKVVDGFRGATVTALIELLDPVQNVAFRDEYVDVPFSLSECTFVLSANCLHSIPAALLDRVEVVEMPGYSRGEKLEIARRFLLPQIRDEFGLDHLDVDPVVLAAVIDRYTREAGVRGLRRVLERMARTARRPIAEPDLEALLGPPTAPARALRPEDAVGAVATVSVGSMGGCASWMEVVVRGDGGGLTLTTGMGEVLKDAIRAARTCIGVEHPEVLAGDVHVHMTGAHGKDGSSAGLAAALALRSACSGDALRADTVVTGEVSLHGMVLPVAGLGMKLLAAQAEGFTRALVPRANAREVARLCRDVREAVEVVFVDCLEDAWGKAVASSPAA